MRPPPAPANSQLPNNGSSLLCSHACRSQCSCSAISVVARSTSRGTHLPARHSRGDNGSICCFSVGYSRAHARVRVLLAIGHRRCLRPPGERWCLGAALPQHFFGTPVLQWRESRWRWQRGRRRQHSLRRCDLGRSVAISEGAMFACRLLVEKPHRGGEHRAQLVPLCARGVNFTHQSLHHPIRLGAARADRAARAAALARRAKLLGRS